MFFYRHYAVNQMGHLVRSIGIQLSIRVLALVPSLSLRSVNGRRSSLHTRKGPAASSLLALRCRAMIRAAAISQVN